MGTRKIGQSVQRETRDRGAALSVASPPCGVVVGKCVRKSFRTFECLHNMFVTDKARAQSSASNLTDKVASDVTDKVKARSNASDVTDKVKARCNACDVTDETKARSSTSESNIKFLLLCVCVCAGVFLHPREISNGNKDTFTMVNTSISRLYFSAYAIICLAVYHTHQCWIYRTC